MADRYTKQDVYRMAEGLDIEVESHTVGRGERGFEFTRREKGKGCINARGAREAYKMLQAIKWDRAASR